MNQSIACETFVYQMAKNATIQSKVVIVALTLLNSISTLVAVTGNTLVIAAVFKNPSLQAPSFKLIVSLCFSDLATGLICHPLFIMTTISFLTTKLMLYCAIHKLSIIPSVAFIWISFLTVTAISVDRFLALKLRINYKTIVTNRRTSILVILTWATAILITIFSGIFIQFMVVRILLATLFLSCLIVIMASYIKCFQMLNAHCSRIQPPAEGQPNNNEGPSTLRRFAIDVIKYKNALYTTLVVLALVIFSYIPLFASLLNIFVFDSEYGESAHVLTYVFLTIYGLNPALNPLIYIIRMREIRRACWRFFKKETNEEARNAEP